MIPTWRVLALKMGELTVERSAVIYGQGFGEKIVIPIWAAAISGAGHKIIVDTGIHETEWVIKNLGPCTRKSDEEIVEAIKLGVGWAPDDVDIVINTHLHHDHCGDNRMFKNATFIVQEGEWRYAFDPIPSQRKIYLKELYGTNAVDYFSWKFVNGEAEIVPGVKVFPTPGHTPGHQSVIVKTREGTVCIAGDSANTLANIREDVPIGFLTNTGDAFKSMEAIRQRARFIICGHEPSIQKFQEGGFPTVA